MDIISKSYWSAIGCKLTETLISVKLWIIVFASYFAFKIFSIVNDIKQTSLKIIESPEGHMASTEVLTILTNWSSKLLDVTLAMFTGVIVVITLSREVFKHAKISKSYCLEGKGGKEDNVKSGMV